MIIQKYHRRSVRLNGYNYSSKGLYFVTVCTQDRKCLFGEIIEQQIHLNDYGNIVQNEWLKTTMVRLNVTLDKFVIMPNHVHGIIIITNRTDHTDISKTDRRGVLQYAPTIRFRSPSQTIGSIIRGFKSTATKQINILRKTPVRAHCNTPLPIWQRNYYEHIIRDEGELNRIRQYVIDNPLNWDSDKENPNRITKSR